MPEFCKACKAPVKWVVTAKGKRQPIDTEPSAKGNIVVDEFGNGRVLKKGESLPMGFVGPFMPHHATCPFADEFRGSR